MNDKEFRAFLKGVAVGANAVREYIYGNTDEGEMLRSLGETVDFSQLDKTADIVTNSILKIPQAVLKMQEGKEDINNAEGIEHCAYRVQQQTEETKAEMLPKHTDVQVNEHTNDRSISSNVS